jgi:hypothetical protein
MVKQFNSLPPTGEGSACLSDSIISVHAGGSNRMLDTGKVTIPQRS